MTEQVKEAKDYFSFDKTKIKKVKVSEIRPNTWNPKDKDDPDYERVLHSVEINGLTQPIFVRENDDGKTKYEILDGEHRHRAAMDLGMEEIYIYNEGEVPDELAKSLTIWHEVGVEFNDYKLAPLVLELNKLDIELPYYKDEIDDFVKKVEIGEKEKEETEEDGFKTLKIRMTADQFEVVHNAITLVSKNEDVSESKALELLVADGLAGYNQTNYIPENQ